MPSVRLVRGVPRRGLRGAERPYESGGAERGKALWTHAGKPDSFRCDTSVEAFRRPAADAPWPLFMDPERKWYRTGQVETGVHQFLVQDPDGYLIRFSAAIGERPADAVTG